MLYINSSCIDYYNQNGETLSWIYDHDGNRAWKLHWVSTDGWRGYYTAVPVKKYGWVKIKYEGWVTGDWDDAPKNSRPDVVDKKLRQLASYYDKRGYDLEAVFILTSNVFSTAFEAFKKKRE